MLLKRKKSLAPLKSCKCPALSPKLSSIEVWFSGHWQLLVLFSIWVQWWNKFPRAEFKYALLNSQSRKRPIKYNTERTTRQILIGTGNEIKLAFIIYLSLIFMARSNGTLFPFLFFESTSIVKFCGSGILGQIAELLTVFKNWGWPEKPTFFIHLLIPEPSDVVRTHFTFSLGELKAWTLALLFFLLAVICSSDDADPDTGPISMIVGFIIKLQELQ